MDVITHSLAADLENMLVMMMIMMLIMMLIMMMIMLMRKMMKTQVEMRKIINLIVICQYTVCIIEKCTRFT